MAAVVRKIVEVILFAGLFHRFCEARRLLGSSFGAPGNATFDYVVIGGGTAGLAIATRLAEGSRSVAVIEAGSFYEISNSNYSQVPLYAAAFTAKSPFQESPQVDWGFTTTPQPGFAGQAPLYARGKCLGGSSARNYLSYQIGPSGTYDQWAQLVGDDDYKFKNFQKYFQKSLKFTPPSNLRPANATASYDPASFGSQSGPLSVTFANYAMAFSSWARLALDQLGFPRLNGFTSGNILGQSYQLLTLDAQSFELDSSETSFLQKLGLPNSNLIVYPSTLAKQVIFDANKKATGVMIDFGGESFLLSAKEEVILSAGAFQSPQLLMVSGVGPAPTLKAYNIPVIADLPGVGQNMWDHVVGGPSFRVNVLTTTELSINPTFNAQAVQDYLAEPPKGMLTDAGSDLLAFERLPNRTSRPPFQENVSFSSDWPDVEYIITSAFLGDLSTGAQPLDGYNYASISTALVAPYSRGNVTINSADAAKPPVINPNWLTDPQDQAVIVAGYKRARQIFNSRAMAPILIGTENFPGVAVQTDTQILDTIKKTFTTVFHASCTCKMGQAKDPAAVVDSKARVFGVKGLRVVDAASFALLPPGHPVSTVYALAEKIAADILSGK
ncbi:hypothetical protein N7G274_001240 [Stereocaulon virgatum]|uniref:Glucose-methanol-choline oxidoreductase N-terminal domain-containing protein n=1 Tax=Stereocaulon virgatum TaxID=373712 RepID=A0ABR4AQZ7_9LECA